MVQNNENLKPFSIDRIEELLLEAVQNNENLKPFSITAKNMILTRRYKITKI